MPARESEALTLEGVTSGYRDSIVLRGVDLVVPRGFVVGLLGPNGAGKTTLLRTVSGLLAPRQGSIRMYGRTITRDRPAARAKAGLCHIPEGRGIYRTLTVRENLLVQSPPGAETESVERAVSAFPALSRRLHQGAGTLSGGEQQMLAFAAAYVRDPALVLVDEPSFGLAPLIVEEIFTFLEQRARAGTAILLVDQFANRVLELADTAYVLRKGTIAWSGTAAELRGEDLFKRYVGEP